MATETLDDNRLADSLARIVAVFQAASAYCQSVIDYEENGRPAGVSMDEWHYQHLQKQTAMIDAYKKCLVFPAR